MPPQRPRVHDRRRSDLSDYFLNMDLLDMEIFEVLSLRNAIERLRPQMSSLFRSRCYSEWLIPAPGESYLPSLTEAGIRKRSETISRDARLGPWKFPSIVSLPRYASGQRISRSNLRPSLSISSKSLRSPSLPVERWRDSILASKPSQSNSNFLQEPQIISALALNPLLLDAQ